MSSPHYECRKKAFGDGAIQFRSLTVTSLAPPVILSLEQFTSILSRIFHKIRTHALRLMKARKNCARLDTSDYLTLKPFSPILLTYRSLIYAYT